MFDRVFLLRDDRARAQVEGLIDLSGPYLERWILVTRHHGVAWVVRRRLIGGQEIMCAPEAPWRLSLPRMLCGS